MYGNGASVAGGVHPVGRVSIGNVAFANISATDVTARLVAGALAGHGKWLVTANVDHLRQVANGGTPRALVDEADIVVADGTPLVWLTWLAGTPLVERVADSSIVYAIADEAARRNASVLLIGGNPGVADRAAEVLSRRAPGLDVAGVICPPFGYKHDDDAVDAIADRLVAGRPHVVLVALGFPKQDVLIRQLRQRYSPAAYVGVGIAL